MSEWKNALPPVGEVVKWYEHQVTEKRCVVVGYDGDGVVVRIEKEGRYACILPEALHPLKSEAELKREKAVEEMIAASVYSEDASTSLIQMTYTHKLTKKQAEQLFDAGYRKVNELTDEQIDRCVPDAFRAGACWARAKIMGEES